MRNILKPLNKMQNELNNQDQSFCQRAKMSLYSAPITEIETIANITTFELYVKIKFPNFKNETLKIRETEDKSKRDILKATTLFSVTPSGEFTRRNQNDLITHSGIICLDFDHVLDLDDLKSKLLSDKEIDTLLLFQSPSGEGLKWFIRIPPNALTHVLYFEAIQNYIKLTYNIEVDKKCKNISRACFLSHDPEAYLNAGSPNELGKEFLSKWIPITQYNIENDNELSFDSSHNIEKVRSIIEQLTDNKINIAEDYEDWLKIGFSLCSLEENGRDFFHSISKLSNKYDKREVDDKFSSLLSNYNGEISLGTLFYLAELYGIKPKIKDVNQSADKAIDYPSYSKKLRTMNERLMDAKKLPKIKRLVGNIWCKGEVHILFGDNGTGKSVWATQIANSLSKGVSTFDNLPNQAGVQKVLFYDFELSDNQIIERYSDDNGEVYPFNSNLIIDSLDFTDPYFINRKGKLDQKIIGKIKEDIIEYKADVLIIDNITFLRTEATQDANVALELIKSLLEFKKLYGISIMVLAHTPKVKPGFPITNNDLAGSKHLSNLVDSISAIGVSASDKTIKYIKSIKCRSTEKEFDATNVLMVKQEKIGSFLQFSYLEQGNEYDLIRDPLRVKEEEMDEEVKKEVLSLYNQKISYRKIAEMTGLSKSTVCRIIQDYRGDENNLL